MNRPPLKFDIPEGTSAKPCRSCGAPIYFIPRPREPEKKHPVNPDGQSHFSSCPEAAQFRRQKR
jgi:hypothetical protein